MISEKSKNYWKIEAKQLGYGDIDEHYPEPSLAIFRMEVSGEL